MTKVKKYQESGGKCPDLDLNLQNMNKIYLSTPT